MHGGLRPAARGAARARSLTQLHARNLGNNVFSSVPTEFQTFSPSNTCLLDSDGFSCANVGFGTTCCNAQNCGDTSTCSGAPPAPEPCNPGDTACDAGGACPGGTLVSAECADRSAFDESPCACTALQQLAALSTELQGENPWKKLADKAYCQTRSELKVECVRDSAGVLLPGRVLGSYAGLAGALPPSLGDLGPSSLTELLLFRNALTAVPTEIGVLTRLEGLLLYENAITSLPTEIGTLRSLELLDLYDNGLSSVPSEIAALDNLKQLQLGTNQLTGVPLEFRAVDPSIACDLSANPGFSCANVNAETFCCIEKNCPEGTSTCFGAPAPPSTCTYADTKCAEGAVCPGGTLVSAECADRSAFTFGAGQGENPCACSALQQLAAMSTTVSNLPPWSDLANTAYCNNFYLIVTCEIVDNVLLPNDVTGYNQGLTGRMPVSVGDLGPVLTRLVIKGTGAISSLPTEIGTLTSLEGIDLSENALTSVPTEIGALTSLSYLYLVDNAITSVPSEIAALPSLSELRLLTNALTGVPPEFQTWGPSVRCELASNPGFSCANVGADTTCCSADNCGDVTSCY